ncbi:MAG TPA: hypothetical protein VL860_00605 [Planctomycetota bacterium]|nr:hypothetical protein [Planctomycetota bacterium]
MSTTMHTASQAQCFGNRTAPETFRELESFQAPVAKALPEVVTEEQEGKAFYIVTTVAGVTMILLSIFSVCSMVYFFATQA